MKRAIRTSLRRTGLTGAARRLDAAMWAIRLGPLRRRDVRRVALASYPRSGNTWLRSLIELATGEPTGSIYEDRVMPRGKEGIAIKTHAVDSYRYTHAVHVVRNPFDAISSYFHWTRDVAGRTDVEWDPFVKSAIAGWRNHAEHWLVARIPIHRLRFEDLRRNTAGELRSICAFLGRDLPDETIESAIEESKLTKMREKNPHLGKKFFRKGSIHGGLEAFSSGQKALVVAELGDLLRRLGYDLSARPEDAPHEAGDGR